MARRKNGKMSGPGYTESGESTESQKAPAQEVINGSYLTIDHGTLVRWMNDADDYTLEARTLAEKARDYYDGKQWTDSEVQKLKKQKQAPTVINRIKPKMDGLMGMERANKTTAKAYPRTPKHEGAATAATESIRYVLQNNNYNNVRSACWDNLAIEGTCGAEVIVNKDGDDFRITINHLMWDRLVYDPHSRKKDFSDARYLGQVIWLDYDEAIALYPGKEDILENMVSGSETYEDKPRWMDNTRNRVKIVELYYRKDGEIWYSCFTYGGYLKEPKKSPFVNEEGETEWPYEFASSFVSREGVRYGAVRQLMDIQDEVNKRRSKALHLMSVRQVRLERGAVEDINKARQELAKPDGVLETTPGMEFEILKTGDMAAAQFNLLTEAKSEIDSVSYSAAAAGKETRSMSGIALRSREMASQTELAPMFDVLRNLDIRIYRKVWNRIKQYWDAEKWIRITDDENNLKFVGLNAPITAGQKLMEEAQKRGLPPEAMQQLQQRIAVDPSMQQIVGTQNDIADLDMDIVISDVPDSVTTQAEDFVVLGEMVKSGFQMPPLAVIEASPLSNKEKILKMMREQQQQAVPPQIQQQMQQMQEAMQKMAQENQSLKTSQSEAAAKINANYQEGIAKLEADKQIKMQEIAIKAETDVDGALQAIRSLVKEHEIKVASMLKVAQAEHDAQIAIQNAQVAAAEASNQDAAENVMQEEAAMQTNGMEAITALIEQQHQQFMQAIGMIAAALESKKKTISMMLPDGRQASAEVTVQ